MIVVIKLIIENSTIFIILGAIYHWYKWFNDSDFVMKLST